MFKILHAARQKMKQNWKMVYLGRWKRETGLKLFFHTASTWGGKMMTQVLCLVAQSCPSLCDPMDCSPTGTSVHGDSPSHSTGVGCHAFLQGIFLTQESNLCLLQLLHCRWILHCWATGESHVCCIHTYIRGDLLYHIRLLLIQFLWRTLI